MFRFRIVPRLGILLTPCLLFAAAAANASTYYVSKSGTDKNPGISLANPYATIQHAIDKAVAGDTIYVVADTYTGKGNRDINFGGKDLTLEAYPNSDGITTMVTLDLQYSARGFLFQSGETAASVIDGFKVMKGYHPYDTGGGAYIKASSPTFIDCTFASNTAFAAGGIYIYSYAKPSFSGCTFSKNVGRVGGGVYMDFHTKASFTDCTFTGNSALYGGGVYTYSSSDTYTNCTFSGNTAAMGGGLYTTSNANLSFYNSTFSANHASDRGGASFIGNQSSIALYNGVVTGNSAVSGGAFYNSYLANSNLYNTTVSGNTATYRGGAIFDGTRCYPVIFGCILWNDTAGAGGNEIFNTSVSSVPTVTNTDIQGGWAASGTNQNVDPLFVSAQDLHLQAASPLINQGTAQGATIQPKTGNLSLASSVSDLGATALPTPSANDDSYSVLHNTMLVVNASSGVLANDFTNKGGMLSAVLVSGPSIGALTLNPDGSFSYKPANGYVGTITFRYQAKNANGTSGLATVYITVR